MSTILLIGGPMDLDQTEIPDDGRSSAFAVRDELGTLHTYYILRDWETNRWVARHQSGGAYPS